MAFAIFDEQACLFGGYSSIRDCPDGLCLEVNVKRPFESLLMMKFTAAIAAVANPTEDDDLALEDGALATRW